MEDLLCDEHIIYWIKSRKYVGFMKKHVSFSVTKTHFLHEIIQQMTYVDGLKPSRYTTACYTECKIYSRYVLMDRFWSVSINVMQNCQIDHNYFKTHYLWTTIGHLIDNMCEYCFTSFGSICMKSCID